MAAIFADSAEGLTQVITVAATSNFSWCGWFYVSGQPTSGTWRTFTYHGNDPVALYTQYVWIGHQGSDNLLHFATSDAADAFGPALTVGWHHLAYTRSSTTHKVYLDGIEVVSHTQSFAAYTFTAQYLGTDTYADDWDPGKVGYYREWDTALTAAEVRTEGASPTVVKTANLVTNTPLLNDLLDDTANGNDWSESGGTITFEAQPSPLNPSEFLAFDIGTLPFAVTVDPLSASAEIWYKYTQETNQVIGILCCNATAREAAVELYLGNNPASLSLQTDEFNKRAFEWSVASGTDVYFKIFSSDYASGDTLTLSILPGPTDTIAAGDLLVLTDDTFTNLYDGTYKGFFPATWFVPSTGTVRHSSAAWPAAELGVSLTDGKFAIAAKNVGTQARVLILYNASQVEVARATFTDTIRSLGTDLNATYYVLTSPVFATAGTLYTVNTAGVTGGTTWTLAVGNVGTVGAGGGGACMGVARDGSILYYPHSIVGGLVRRKDLPGNTDLSSFATPDATHIPGDVLVQSDGTIVAVFYKSSVPKGNLVVHYNTSGTILNTIDFGSTVSIHHIVHDADDDAAYVWVWTELTESELNDGSLRGSSRLRRVNLTTEAATADWTTHLFSDLGSLADGIGPFDPSLGCGPERFGAPASCPLMIMMGAGSDVVTESENTIDCPHGSYHRTLSGSGNTKGVVGNGVYDRVRAMDASRVTVTGDGVYDRVIDDLSGSF